MTKQSENIEKLLQSLVEKLPKSDYRYNFSIEYDGDKKSWCVELYEPRIEIERKNLKSAIKAMIKKLS